MKRLLVLGLVSAVAGATPGLAGGFAARERSAEFQGMSFAGNAASGGGLSGMFWNPAIAAYAPSGIAAEFHGAGIFGNTNVSGVVGAGGVNLGLPPDSGNMANDVFLPSGYLSARLSKDLVLALSVNRPFSLSTEPSNRFWAGQTFTPARGSLIESLNVTPTIAYSITPTLSVGVGLQVEILEARLRNASGITPASLDIVAEGNSQALGFTAGLNWTPTPQTSIGLGYRSSIQHWLNGTIALPGSPVPPAATGSPIAFELDTPDIVTLSGRYAVTDQLRLLGTVEWSHWNKLQSLRYVCTGIANPVFCPAGAGQLVRTVTLGWHDGWMFSGGLEYMINPAITARAGAAYELSPIRNPIERWVGAPDMDRVWLSFGATFRVSEKVSFDFAYSHIFGVGDGAISRTEGGLTFAGNASLNADIVSGSLKIRF